MSVEITRNIKMKMEKSMKVEGGYVGEERPKGKRDKRRK